MTDDEKFRLQGAATMLPGMQYMKDKLIAFFDQHIELVRAMQDSANGTGKITGRRVRPSLAIAAAIEAQPVSIKVVAPKKRSPSPTVGKAIREYWAGMTDEARSAEAHRRQAVRRGEAPSEARSESGIKAALKAGHAVKADGQKNEEARRKKIGEMQRNSWSNLTKKQHAQRVRNAAAGRAAAAALRSQQQNEATA